ncbi:FliH/SctL family protein [Homoserinimonas sp. A447]
MSIDASFLPVSFPALRNSAQDAGDLRSRVSGHAAGYAAGLNAAADDLAAQKAEQEAALADAIAAGQARMDEAVAVLNAATVALERRTVPRLQEAQDAIAATAIELAEAIIGRELQGSDTSARSALQRALSDVDPALVNVVRLNPGDLAALDQQTILAAGVTFVADAALERGDAVTEFADGYLDARVSAALERARDAIFEEGP